MHPQATLTFLALNTRRPLFADVRLRRAANYAIDRGALSRLGAVQNPMLPIYRAREVGCNLSKLTSWGTINFYLNGRTNLIKSGMLRPEDNLEDLWFMVDFHHRFNRAYQRNGAHVWTLDANDIAHLTWMTEDMSTQATSIRYERIRPTPRIGKGVRR